MKKIALLLCAILITCLSFALTSCECEHEYGKWTVTKAATCSAVGEQERICSKCEEVEKGEIPKVTDGGHVYGDWQTIVEPTCSKEGKKERTCTLCSKKGSAIIPALTEGGHTYGEWVITVEPTCSTEGQRVQRCKDCDSPNYETLSPVDENGHSFGQWQTVTEPTCSTEGEQTRDCIYCDEKETEKIPVLTSGGHSFGAWTVTTEPTCSTEGEQERSCTACGANEIDTLSPLDEGGHSFGSWQTITEPTCDKEGEAKRECALCEGYETKSIDKLPVVYTITVNIDGAETVVNVPESGKYSLTAPTKLGYEFTGWTDGITPFPASGIVTENKSITANFEILPTKTFNELKSRLEGGADKILIADNITLSDTIYVINEVEIYTIGNYTLTRDASFTKDLFVLGEDRNGDSSILSGSLAKVTIKPIEGATLTIDGNKSNLTDTVVGTAFFMTSGSTLNIYDGVTLQNHKKLGNEKILDTKYAFNGGITAGGSVVLINDGTLNVYGGLFTANEVSPLNSSMTPDEQKVEGYDNSTYGGAVYSLGTINIYGGTFSENKASYGGAIASGRVINIEAGLFENNSSSYYGGALYQTNNAASVAYIGKEGKDISVIFRGNSSLLGGAIRTQYNSGTIIYGGTLFDSNKALSHIVTEDVLDEETGEPTGETTNVVITDGRGGAIQCYGELIIYYAEFKNNYAMERGGAIDAKYSSEDLDPRVIKIYEALFDGNTASLGAGIAGYSDYDASSDAIIELGNVTFTNNKASSNGGAIYLTVESVVNIFGNATFKNNSADSKGGAFYLTNASRLEMLESSSTLIEGNTANSYGGAAHLKTDSTIIIRNATFKDNTSGSNGGAIYSTGSTVNVMGTSDKIVSFTGNVSDNRGGAIYVSIEGETQTTLNVSYASFTSNTANEKAEYGGGAIYSTNSIVNLDNSTFDGNHAVFGGAISLYTQSVLTGEKLVFTNNVADAYGGVIYTSKATVTLTDITASGNKGTGYTEAISETEEKYHDSVGGAFYFNSNTTATLNKITAENNSANFGGFMTVGGGATATILSRTGASTISGNASTSYGGAIYCKESSTLNIEATNENSITFSGNNAGSHGGAIFNKNSTIKIVGTESAPVVFESNETDKQGGAIYLITDSETVTAKLDVSYASFETNTAKQVVQYGGGAIYSSGGVINLDNTSFDGNHAIFGGAISLYSGSVLTGEKITFTNNIADLQGGVIYTSKATVTLTDSSASGNKALGATTIEGESETHTNGYGGAFYFNTTTTAILNNVSFVSNTAQMGGAVVVYGDSNVTFTDCTFDGNTTTRLGTNDSQGGAIYSYKSENTLNNCTIKNSSAGTRGSAIYSTTSTVTLKGCLITENTGNDSIVYFTKSTFNSTNDTYTRNSTKTGVIYINTNTVATIVDAIMEYNTATSHGGCIYIPNGTLTIDNLSATSNTSGGNGGAIHITSASASATIKNSSFTGNSTPINNGSYGGAIFAGNSATLTLTDVVFTSNVSSNGGAIGLAGASLTINGITASKNEASDNSTTELGNGGAIGVKDGSTGVVIKINAGTTITENTFTDNKASHGGGAIYLKDSEGEFTANQLTFTGNEATSYYGGGLLLRASSPELLTVDIGTIVAEGNTAGGNGGALYLYKLTGTLDSLTANNNSANNGGAIYLAGSTAIDIGALYGSGNSAITNGGYAYMGTSTTRILSGELGENNDENGYELYFSVKINVKTDSFTFPEGGINDASKIVVITE